MATRRSRIKAVANLPVRRNRPVASSDSTNEKLDDEDVEKTTSPSKKIKSEYTLTDTKEKADGPSKQTETDADFSTPDRKSVIVAVEKDRKSVIVNRDHCINSTNSSSADGVNGSCHELLTSVAVGLVGETTDSTRSHSEENSSSIDVNHCIAKTTPSSLGNKDPIVCESSVTNSTSQPEAGKDRSVTASSHDGSVIQNNRLPLRSRRTKPTVNLTAATRKRPSNDLSLLSPCSPPPNKLKPSELLQRKISESDNVIIPTSTSEEKKTLTVPSDLNEPTNLSDASTSTPAALPPEAHLNDKAVSESPGTFKTPESSPSKSKDNLQETASDTSNTSDKTSLSTHKETSLKRKQSVNAQKVAAARKSLKSRLSTDGPLPRSSLTMFDLIFYNPSKNPMKSTDSSSQKLRERLNSVSSVSSIREDRLNEESIDDVDGDGGKENTNDDIEETAMPVPQVKVGPDGSLILDEQSLVIETTGTKKSLEELERSEVVIETGSSYGHYKKIIRSKDWSDHETKKFYRALNVVGTDFSLMKPYFRNRTRRELKLKFKKEEKLNAKLINKALAEPLDFDISELEKECELEDEEEKRLEELARKKEAEGEAEKDKPDADENAKKPVKKRKPKRSAAIAEILSEEEENTPGTSVFRKPTPKARLKKVKRDKNADDDYNMLALGVDLSEQKQYKRILPEGSCPQTSKKKIVPLSASSGANSKSSPVGSFDSGAATESNSTIPIKKISDGSDVLATNLHEGANPEEADQARHYKKKPAKNLKKFPISSSSIDDKASQDKTASVPSLEVLTSPLDTRLCTPTSSKIISSPGMKVLTAPVPNTPLRLPPLVGIGMSTPNTIQLVRRPIVQTTPIPASAVFNNATITSPMTVQSTSISTSTIYNNTTVTSTMTDSSASSKVSLSTPLRTVQMSGSVVPSTSTCGGSKVYTSTPPTRIRTIQVTPQNILNQASFGATTPVSRLLPSTPPLPRMEPGSIIVLKTPLPQNPDRHVLQVYMVTNTPQGSSPHNAIPISPNMPGINLLSGPSVQPASGKSPCISDDSDNEKVLTKL